MIRRPRHLSCSALFCCHNNPSLIHHLFISYVTNQPTSGTAICRLKHIQSWLISTMVSFYQTDRYSRSLYTQEILEQMISLGGNSAPSVSYSGCYGFGRVIFLPRCLYRYKKSSHFLWKSPFGQISRSFSLNSHHYSPQTIGKSDSKGLSLVTASILGQPPSTANAKSLRSERRSGTKTVPDLAISRI